MKTYTPRPRDIERRWYLIDASGAVLGRLASEVAAILRGKHKPIFAPHMDTGDHVVVVNASGVRLTGGKEEKKLARPHSGYPGGLARPRTRGSWPPGLPSRWRRRFEGCFPRTAWAGPWSGS